MEIPLPVIFDRHSRQLAAGPVVAAVAQAAAGLGSLAVVEAADGAAELRSPSSGHVIPLDQQSGRRRQRSRFARRRW